MPVGKRAGVLGWPVAHSRSPQIHEAAYRVLGLDDWRYQLLPVPPELLLETVAALPGAGFVGVNVTIPHKQTVLAAASEATDAAREIGAVNALTFADGGIHADNTDAPGLLAALPHSPGGARAMVLGAGGSARAAVWALLGAGAEVMVWNRTPERARELCSALGGSPVAHPQPADVLVNCTAVGLVPGSDPWNDLSLSPDAVRAYACVVDVAYGAGETELIAAAREAGAAVVDGLEVLVRQGALSLEQWTGMTAPLDAMRAAAVAEPGSRAR